MAELNEYLCSLASTKSVTGMSWKKIATEVNQIFDSHLTADIARKRVKKLTQLPATGEELLLERDMTPEELLSAIKKERVKLSDERVQVNAQYRRIAREETLKEIAHDVASHMNEMQPLKLCTPSEFVNSSKEGILQISDWHYGIVIDNVLNKYDTEVARQRVEQLLNYVKAYCREQCISKLHVVNLGDMIAGRIHLQLRLNSRIDVVTQTIEVSELLAQFLNALGEDVSIDYYDTLDNHSRLEPKREDALNLESLARMIPWYLLSRNIKNVTIHNNVISPDIVKFECLGHTILGVHGDKDPVTTLVPKLPVFIKEQPDLILSAHNHHFRCEEVNEIIVLSNSSIMGTDDYAFDKRLSAKPSQNLIFVTEDNPMADLKRIVVD